MSAYPPGIEKTLTLARRTKKNLEFIYSQKAEGADVEEFTHLLNSMLGMMISLREEYVKGKNIAWADIVAKGLVPVSVTANAPTAASPNLICHASFSQLISRTRHAFAHNSFELLNDGDNNIRGILIWNIEPPTKANKPENRTWEAEFSEQQLKDLAFLFIDYIENEYGP